MKSIIAHDAPLIAVNGDRHHICYVRSPLKQPQRSA
jgi:hypothetical protein